jgi:hypothetical protein
LEREALDGKKGNGLPSAFQPEASTALLNCLKISKDSDVT